MGYNKTNINQQFSSKLIQELKNYSGQLKDLYIKKLTDKQVSATSSMIQEMATYMEEISPHVYVAGLKLPEYWEYIENGREPGRFPPPDSITNWISSRQIIPQPYELPGGKTVIPTVQQLAFLIGRKIARDGIPARPYLQESVEELKELINSIVTGITKNTVQKVIQEIPTIEI
ncbi:MAG: hypothetical protein LUH10_00450 [Tannerellaceae bacterium]|nr:hypothetical protein [Tannerellaceae bacterium]